MAGGRPAECEETRGERAHGREKPKRAGEPQERRDHLLHGILDTLHGGNAWLGVGRQALATARTCAALASPRHRQPMPDGISLALLIDLLVVVALVVIFVVVRVVRVRVRFRIHSVRLEMAAAPRQRGVGGVGAVRRGRGRRLRGRQASCCGEGPAISGQMVEHIGETPGGVMRRCVTAVATVEAALWDIALLLASTVLAHKVTVDAASRGPWWARAGGSR